MPFNNDQVLEIMQRDGVVSSDATVDYLEPHFRNLCERGMMRNIAENFTTIWFKLFGAVTKFRCGTCGKDICLGSDEARICPESCGANL